MHEQPSEPRIEAIGVLQAWKVPPAPDESLLGGVLRPIRITEDRSGRGEQPIDDVRSEHRERIAVAVACSFDQRPVHATSRRDRLVATHHPHGVASRREGSKLCREGSRRTIAAWCWSSTFRSCADEPSADPGRGPGGRARPIEGARRA